MITILSLLITIGVIAGTYYMGKYTEDTSYRSYQTSQWSMIFGLMIWAGIIGVLALIGLFFWGVHSLLTQWL